MAETETTTDEEIFNVDVQAEFMKNFGIELAKDAKKFGMDKDESALDPLKAVDAIKASLQITKADQEYIDAVESMKTDPDVLKAIDIFQRSLEGKENIHKIADLVPQPEGDGPGPSFVAFRDDPGLNGAVIQGKMTPDAETDLIRMSNYLSGAGTSVGGFFADLPNTVASMANGINNASLFRYQRIQDKLDKHSRHLSKVIAENDAFALKAGYNPEDAYRKRKGFEVDLGGIASKDNKNKVKVRYQSTQSRLLHETFAINGDLEHKKSRVKGKLKSQKILGKIGSGIQGATSAFGIGMGGADIFAGDQMIQRAHYRYRSGEISAGDYEKAIRDGRLRIAQGSFGIGDGVNNIRALIVDKVADKVKAASKGARMGLRFASVVGGALSIGMGVTSITKNAIAAQDADESGNIGKAAMYGIMAGLDCVSVVLDAVSMVLDFIPGIGQAISFVVDLVNTIVGLVNMVIGFFADMVDTRTPEEKLQEALKEHIESPAFQQYIKNQADMYKEEGYDLFKFMIDSDAVGLEEEGAENVEDTIVRKLSEKAKQDATAADLRLALVDATTLGKKLEGRSNDDKILAGAGADTLYGHDGDDLLFGQADNDTIYGGPGNDYLNGGTARDDLIGGQGDDYFSYQPGIDTRVLGGEYIDGSYVDTGTDTLQLTADFFASTARENAKALRYGSDERKRVYVNLSKQATGEGHGGVSLGALLDSLDCLSNRMHKPGFSSNSTEASTIAAKFSSSTTIEKNVLNGCYLWYLANKNGIDYVTDGKFFYSFPVSGENRDLKKATYSIQSIDTSEAHYDQEHNCIAYKTNALSGALAFAFRTSSVVRGIEKICEPTSLYYTDDVHSQVIGDNTVGLIDIGFGDNEYVYTGDGDTVVLFTLSNSPQWEIMKYIVGGSGNNTLIINAGSRSATRGSGDNLRASVRYQCLLFDHDTVLSQANRVRNEANEGAWPTNNSDKVDRGVFLKNMKTIQLSSTGDDFNTFHVDCTNLSEGHRFIINNQKSYMRFIGSAGDDSIVIKHVSGNDNVIDGHLGTNLLIMASDEQLEVDIDVPPSHLGGTISGQGVDVMVRNIHSVRGNANTTIIRGHHAENNLLFASGGSCYVSAGGGSNTLVAMRGYHTLVGGNGQDGYELHGPTITEFEVITVSRKKEGGIVAQAENGTWAESSRVLTIEVLKSDMPMVTLTTVKLVDDDGNVVEGKGTVSIDQNKIQFTPGSAFSEVKRGSPESVRVQYVTTGSTVIIDEPGVGNRLKLHGFAGKDDIQLRTGADGDLECYAAADNSDEKIIIFKDRHWRRLLQAGITNLDALFIDFADRFPTIQFNGTDQANAEISDEGILDFLNEKLGHLKRTSSVYDNFIDAKNISGNLIDSQGGNNFVLGTRRNVTYKCGDGINIFDFTDLTDGPVGTMEETLLQTGFGETAVAITDVSYTVKINFIKPGRTAKRGFKSLIIKSIGPNDLTVTEVNSRWRLSHSQNLLATLDCAPDVIMFKKSSNEEILIDDVTAYLERRKDGGSYNWRRVYNENHEQKLIVDDFETSDMKLDISVKVNGLDVKLKTDTVSLYNLWLGVPTTYTLDAVSLASFAQFEFRNGMVFENKTLDSAHIRQLIMNCLRSSTRHSIEGSPSFNTVVRASKVQSPHYVSGWGKALVYVDKEHSEIIGGRGNDLFKITESNTTVRTGSSSWRGDDYDIVHIMGNCSDVSVKMKSMWSYSSSADGNKCIVIEGISSEALSMTGANDNPLPSYYRNITTIVVKVGARKVVTLDTWPDVFIFRNGDEYELITEAVEFIKKKRAKTWVPRMFVTKDLFARVQLEDLDSSELFFSVYKSTSRTSTVVSLKTDEIFYITHFVLDINPNYGNISSAKIVTLLAGQMQGGIRFQDRFVGLDNLMPFLDATLRKPNTEIDLDSTTILYQDIPSTPLADALKLYPTATNMYAKYLKLVRACNETLDVINIDAEGTLVYPPVAVAEDGDAGNTANGANGA